MEGNQIDVAAIPQTALKVLTSPAAFFREMPKTGGFLAPLAFMVVMGVAGGLVQAVLSLLHLHPGAGVAAGLVSVIVLPILIVIFGFLGAGIAFVVWKMMGSQESFEAAFRCVAYMAALAPVNAVLGIFPFAGAVLAPVLATVFLVTASVEAHRIASRKAWLVFGIMGALFILMGVGAQIAARRLGREAAKFQGQAEAMSKAMEKQASASQKAAEEFAKAMQKQAEQAQKAAEEMQKRMQKEAPSQPPE